MLVRGRRPHWTFRGLLNVHSRYGLSARCIARATHLSRRLRRFRYLHRRPDSYQLERPSCRVGIAPTEDQHLFHAHISDVPFSLPSRRDISSSSTTRMPGRRFRPRWPVGCFPDSSQDEGLLPRGDHEEHRILSDWQEPFQLVAGRECEGPHPDPRAVSAPSATPRARSSRSSRQPLPAVTFWMQIRCPRDSSQCRF